MKAGDNAAERQQSCRLELVVIWRLRVPWVFASGGRRVRRQSVPGPERSAARSHPVGMNAETPIKFGKQEDTAMGYEAD